MTLTNPLPSAAKNAYIDPTSGGGVASALPAAFDKIVNRTSTTITLETPVPTAGSTTLITYTAANGGSTLRDASGNCYNRVNSTYSPKEWGARYSTSAAVNAPDDTVPLQNWLDAPQPHIAVPGYTYITAPLICNANPNLFPWLMGVGIIQGPPTQAVAEDNSILPTFYIMGYDAGCHGLSAPKATTTAAMLVMPLGSTCAIHSIGLIATDTQTSTASYDIVDAQGKSDLIDDHSYLQGGYYNLKSGASGNGGANLEVYDSSFVNSYSDNVLIFSPNAKVVRNSFAGAGSGYSATNPVSGTNISFGSTDILIADNIIQQAAGWAIDVHTARSVRIANNFMDNNGKQIPGTGGARISNTGHVTICGNTFAESGAASLGGSAPYSAHVTFAGSVDSVSLCGNTYLPIHPSASIGSTNTDPSVVLLRPDFDFDVDATSSPLLTNISINDNPAPQNVGVMSPSALLYMPGAIQQPFPRNYLTGLGLIYGGTSTVSINTGTAMDQSSTTPITLSSPCLVDLTKSGAGGLDTGSVQAFKTYFFYVISGPSGANPSCMASASNTTPTFVNTGTTYKIPLKAMTATNSTVVYNVGQASGASATSLNANPLGGILPNDTISSPGYINSTSIASLLPYSVQSVTATAHTGTTGYLDGAPFTGVFPGMGVGGPLIPRGHRSHRRQSRQRVHRALRNTQPIALGRRINHGEFRRQLHDQHTLTRGFGDHRLQHADHRGGAGRPLPDGRRLVHHWGPIAGAVQAGWRHLLSCAVDLQHTWRRVRQLPDHDRHHATALRAVSAVRLESHLQQRRHPG